VSHWIIAPVVLTSMLAAAMVLIMRHHLLLQRVFSVAGILTLVAIAA
jgi:multicomponent K+:H+ antiporter subunit D